VIQQDYEALESLYNATDGANWTNNTNWLTGQVSTWHGVTVTGDRVTSLELNNNQLAGTIPAEIWNLTNLNYLDLSINQLTGSIPAEIGNLTNLTFLGLGLNQLSGTIPVEIGTLTNLNILSLFTNQLTGSIPVEIGNLSNLTYLSLYSNELSGSIPAEIWLLTNLTFLDLGSNQLAGTIPVEIGNLTNLTYLGLFNIQLSGSIPAEIWLLTNLTFLDLGDNQLTGTISVEIGNLTNLTSLQLSSNQFTGAVPTEIGNLTSLTYLELYGNSLTDLPDLTGLSALTSLELQDNYFQFDDLEPNAGITGITYSPQKQISGVADISISVADPLNISYTVGGTGNLYQWFKDSEPIPDANDDSYVVSSATASDAGDYYLQITNPAAPLLTLTTLPTTVTVEGDPYGGVIQQDYEALVALYNATDGANWTNNTNWLTGQVSTWHGVTVTGDRVTSLELNSNQLTGTIPSEIGNLTNLISLQLSINQLTGSIPVEIGNLTNLTILTLFLNQLSGTIPSEIGNLTNVTFLSLSHNQLTGSIPPEIGNLTNVFELNLLVNQLTGTIPAEIGNLTNLTHLSLFSNQLTGSIPAEIGNLSNLTYLYLAENQLSGSVPAEISNLSGLTYLGLFDNFLMDLPDLTGLSALTPLDLQNNYFQFDDLVPNVGISEITYAPQRSIPGIADFSVAEGTELSLSYTIGGAGNLYQWYKDSVAIPEAINDTYVVSSTAASDAGDYYLQITNPAAPLLTLSTLPTTVTVEGDPYGGVIQQDYEALEALYNATNGGSWTNNSNWLNGDVSTWHGVTVTEDRVSAINLSDNNLTGTIPSEIVDLSSLAQLYLQSNQLTDLPDLSSITSLTTLDISNNFFQFDDIEPNIGIGTFTYTPQGQIAALQAVTLTGGQPLSLSYTVGGSANTYRWLKNDVEQTGFNTSTYSVSPATSLTTGSYRLEITSSLVPNLTLSTGVTEVTSTAPASASAVTLSESSLRVSWSYFEEPSGGMIQIERSTEPAGTFVAVGSVSDTLTAFVDTALEPNTTYYYRVKHVNGDTQSDYSNTALSVTFSSGLPDTWRMLNSFITQNRLTLVDVEVDVQGNTYLVGNYLNVITIDGQSFTPTGSNDAIVIKIGPQDDIVWVKSFGGLQADIATSIALSPGGLVYVAGYYNGSFTVDGISVTKQNPGVSDAFVARLNSTTGAFEWLTTTEATGGTAFNDVALDADGNLYLPGFFNGDLTFGASTMLGGGPGLFKVAADGTKLFGRWGVLVGPTRFVNGFNAVRVSGNNVFVAGEVDGEWSFGGISTAKNALRDGVLVSYSLSGEVQWLKTLAGPGEDFASEITVDNAGNVFWVGDFNGATATVSGTTLNNQGTGYELSIVKVNGADGAILWGTTAGTANDTDIPYSVATDGTNLFLAGTMGYGVTTFGSQTLSNGRLFLASYDGGGNVRWVDKSEGTLGLPWGMTYSSQKGGILMTGSFEYTQRFGTTELVSQGSRNGFLAYHNDSGAPIPPTPLNFEAYAEHGGSITLAWSQTPGAATFSIEKSGEKNGPFVSIASLADSTRLFTDNQVGPGQTYYYRIRSQANGLFSEYTNTQGVYSFSGGLTDSWDNVQFFKGKGRQNFLDASTDADGNTYLVGYTSDTIVINGQTLLSKGGFDFLIVKLDATGNPLWSNTYGSTGVDLLEGVKVDSNGNVYAVGGYNGAIEIGGISLQDPGHSEFVTIKLNAATGAVVWAKPSGASGNSGGLSVDVDEGGNVYSSGYFGGNLTHGSTSVTGGGHILLKYSSDGTPLSAIAGTLLSPQAEPVNNFQRVKVSGSGIFVIGNYNNDWNFGGLQATGAGARDVLVAKYNTEGIVQWMTTVKGVQGEEGRDLFVDENGDTYLLANTTSADVTVDTLVVNTQDKTTLIAKLSGTNGRVIWAKTYGSASGGDFPFRIAGSNTGVFVVGTMGIESTDFGNGVTAEGGVMYLASFDSNGLARWADKAEGPAYAWSLTYSAFHNAAVVAGGVHHKVQMGTHQFTGESERDLFFATHADSEALAGVPQITKSIAVDTNTAYLKWLPVTNARFYHVEGKLLSDSTYFQVGLVPSDTTELVFGEALLADSTYQFRVVAFGNSTSQQAVSPAATLTMNCGATPISTGDYRVVISGTKRDGQVILQDESFANIYAVSPAAFLINGITGDYYQKYFGGGILTDTLVRQCNSLFNQTLTDPTGIAAKAEAFVYSTDTLWMDYNTSAGDWLRVRFYKTTDQVDSADLATIVKLYDTTGGDAWTNKTNWKSSLPVGLWHGIETANGRVVRINLPANNLVGNLLPELFAMDSLRGLNLSQNQLTGPLPTSITGLNKLQSFLLADNRLTGEIPSDIGKLTSITSFDLGRNLLVGSLPASIGNLVNLESLFGVMGNKLEGTIPPAIGNLNKLRVLAFDANQFEGKIPQEIGKMAALEQLYLHKNRLSGPLPDSLVRLKKLRVIYLSENELEGPVPAGISSLDSLDQFIVHTNKLSSIPLLTALTTLDSVNVANNKLGFGSIEPNLEVSRFVYSPQGRFGFPVDTLHNAGEAFTFVLNMGGTSNSYQWFKNDAPLSEANSKDLTITEVGEGDEGSYFARVVNSNVAGLTIDTEVYQLKISSLKRDSLALVAIYNATGGPTWTNKTNWTTGNLSTWSGVTVAEGRVAELILPDNRVVGALPPDIRDLANLTMLDLSNTAETFDPAIDNQISFVPDLGRLTLLTEADFTRNRLGFVSIEPNLKALGDKFKFNPQRRIGETRADSVPVGQSHRLAIDVSGENNAYQWYFNDQPIAGSTQRFHIIESVNYEQMGSYFAEVRSSLVPDFFIRNRNQNVLATADLGGTVSFASDQSPLNVGQVSVYQIRSGPYDSLATVQVSSGAYLANRIVLGDYVLLARPDLLTYPDALLTYYSSTIDWLQADTLRLRGNQTGVGISLLAIPPPLDGDGVIKGELESDIPDDEDIDEESRILNRQRVNGAGVSLSRQRARGKGNDDGFDYEFVAYAVTDENGSFSFGTLPDATYLINIQYPGVPMDQSSDLLLTLGEDTDQDEVTVAALVTPNGIVVNQVEVKGIPAPYLKDINVYPNPSEDILQLDYFVRRKVDGLSLRLTDVTGRHLMMKELSFLAGPQRTTLDISSLASGMYVLILSDKQGSFTQSIRVQKK